MTYGEPLFSISNVETFVCPPLKQRRSVNSFWCDFVYPLYQYKNNKQKQKFIKHTPQIHWGEIISLQYERYSVIRTTNRVSACNSPDSKCTSGWSEIGVSLSRSFANTCWYSSRSQVAERYTRTPLPCTSSTNSSSVSDTWTFCEITQFFIYCM